MLYGSQKGLIRRSKSALEVELRGFEPLTPSMRTLGSEVARGRWGRSAADGSLSEPLAVDDVAVFECCTARPPSRSSFRQRAWPVREVNHEPLEAVRKGMKCV